MKKTFSNFRTLAALLMAGAAFAACSSDDNIIENQQPANPGEQVYTLTVNASKGDGTTRALDLDGTKLVASWSNGDELTVFNQTKMAALTGTLTASNASGSTATFAGALTGTIEVGDKLILTYHDHYYFTDFLDQDGTLKGTNGAEEYDQATAEVTVASVDDDGDGNKTITISEASASFKTWTAMLKLTLKDGSSNLLNATSLTISVDGIGELLAFNSIDADASTANGDGVLYFALPSAENVAYIKMGATPEDPSDVEAKKAALASATVTFTATVGGKTYTASKPGYKFTEGKYYAATLTMAPLTDLSKLTCDYTAQDGDVLTGTLDGSTQKYKISIADGATVTLDNATINGVTDGAADAASSAVAWAGLTCEGNATIIVKDGTVNSVTGFHHYLPGIYVPANKTVTIKGGAAGTGVLNVQGSVSAGHGNRTAAAGIGAGASLACGNIVIEGGVINATGGYACAAIGGAFGAACGNITITGGTVTASGSASAAGIGGGWISTSEDIVITGGTVNASSGDALNETDGGPGIGCGSLCSGGTITIGGTANVTAQGGVGAAGIGAGGTFNNTGSICSTITISGSAIVEATGGEGGAGIGAGSGGAGTSRCGNILISGGTVTATAIQYAAGIGTGVSVLGNQTSRCGSITITSGVTKVTATKGNDAYSYCSIGVGFYYYYSEGGITLVAQSGTVTIGGVEYWNNNNFVGSGATYLTQSTLVYQP